jgi:tetratricopeptide (TPR) repeat protein
MEEGDIKEGRTIGYENLSFYYSNRGLANYHSQQLEDALLDYKEAIRLNDQSSENFFNRANVFMSQSQFDEAHKDFDRAVELEPTSAKLYHGKGLAY